MIEKDMENPLEETFESADVEFDQEMESLVGTPEGEIAEIDALLTRIEELEGEVTEAKENHLRAIAEAQNGRRRMQQEMETTRKFATETLVQALIPVLDNFDRTIQAIDQGATLENLTAGVRMVEKQLLSILGGQHVERIKAMGEHFDPTFHEAIGTVEVEGVESGVIVQELESGYVMHGRVVRPSRVRVAK